MIKRVLCYCPTLRLEPESVEAILAQEWDGGFDVIFTRDNPFPVSGEDKHREGEFANIAHAYHKAQLLTIAGGYDALYIVESDNIPPPDALKRLAELDAPVAYGVYVLRHGKPVVNVLEFAGPQLGMSLSLNPQKLREAWGKKMRVSGIGFGCILIRRDVLLRVVMRPGPGYTAPDWAFAEDCLKLDIPQWADLGVLVGHKTPDGRILWPVPGEEFMAKLKIVKDVNYRGKRYTVGQVVDATDETMIYDLTRSGYAEIVESDNGLRKPDATQSVPRNKRRRG